MRLKLCFCNSSCICMLIFCQRRSFFFSSLDMRQNLLSYSCRNSETPVICFFSPSFSSRSTAIYCAAWVRVQQIVTVGPPVHCGQQTHMQLEWHSESTDIRQGARVRFPPTSRYSACTIIHVLLEHVYML